jgi:hypothetical protein
MTAGERGGEPTLPPVVRDLAILAGAFAVATALAEAFGAANLGVAVGFGQLAFAAALVAVLLRS